MVTKIELHDLINNTLLDNIRGNISAQDLRTLFGEVVDSAAWQSDFAGVGVETHTLIPSTTISADIDYIATTGYNAVGDGGGAFYKRSVNEPLHGGVQSADNSWWVIVGDRVNVKQFGAIGDGVADDYAAIQAAIDYVLRTPKNLLQNPNNFATWYGSETATIVSGQMAPNGELEASKVSGAENYAYLWKATFKNSNMAVGTTHTYSIFVAKRVGSIILGFDYFGDVPYEYATVTVDTQTGVVTANEGDVSRTVTVVDHDAGFWRVIISATTGLENHHGIWTYIYLNTSGGSPITDGPIVWGAHLDEGSQAISAAELLSAADSTIPSGTIEFPPGTYNVGAAPIARVAKGLNLIGHGPDQTVIRATGGNAAFETDGFWRCYVRGIGFTTSAARSTGAVVELDGNHTGNVLGVWGCHFDLCSFDNAGLAQYSLAVTRVGSVPGAALQFTSCDFTGNTLNVKTATPAGIVGGLKLQTLTFAELGAADNGTMYYCSNATPSTNPATGGGTGAIVVRQNGVWRAL